MTKLRIAALIACVATTLAAPALAAPTEGLSTNQAISLPPAEVGHRVLGPSGDNIVEVEPPIHGDDAHLYNLTLATRPYATNYPGLCGVRLISLYLKPVSEPAPGARSGGADALSHPEAIDTETRYQVAGSTTQPPGKRTSADDTALDARCARLTRAWSFFPAPDEAAAWMAARATELVAPAVARDHDAADYLRLEHLSRIVSARCASDADDSAEPWRDGVYCQTLTFSRDRPFYIEHTEGGRVVDSVQRGGIPMAVTLKVRLRLRTTKTGAREVIVLSHRWTGPDLDLTKMVP